MIARQNMHTTRKQTASRALVLILKASHLQVHSSVTNVNQADEQFVPPMKLKMEQKRDAKTVVREDFKIWLAT